MQQLGALSLLSVPHTGQIIADTSKICKINYIYSSISAPKKKIKQITPITTPITKGMSVNIRPALAKPFLKPFLFEAFEPIIPKIKAANQK